MIENSMSDDNIWEPPRKKLLECGCEGKCKCDDDDEYDRFCRDYVEGK